MEMFNSKGSSHQIKLVWSQCFETKGDHTTLGDRLDGKINGWYGMNYWYDPTRLSVICCNLLQIFFLKDMIDLVEK